MTAAPSAFAQSRWPDHPIRFVVPFTPGGTTDFVTRLVAASIANALRQPVVVENKPGAGTVIGVDAVAKAIPDGYTFVTVANSFTANQTLVKRLPYKTLEDLRPVAMMGMSEHVLATHPKSGLRSLADLRAKAASGSLSYASFGSGTSAHLSGELLKQKLGVDLIHVPYKGQGPALSDLLGGQVTVMFGNWPEFRGHVRSGKLIALGMATLKRSEYAPDVPTLAEQGAAIESNSWNGLLAPAGTSDIIIRELNAAINAALSSSQVSSSLKENGIASLSGTPEQFAEFIRHEIEKYAEIVRVAKIDPIG